ncbi:MAG: cation:proton antiporter, partial [Geminicoccaceae bacterium]|nr:cation:proton antiporter [Geminicoccaceae bacterium]
MEGFQQLAELMIVLAAAVFFAAVAIRMNLGPIVGYLFGGAVIGPPVLGVAQSAELVAFLGELGVVFLLFAIGLELPVQRIRTIGARTLVLGLLQVVITTVIMALIAARFGLEPAGALAVGAGIA